MKRVISVGAVAQMVERLLSMQEAGGSMPPSSIFQIAKKHKTKKKNVAGKFRLGNGKKEVTAVGFEPTPFRTAALTQRLRPLGHAVDVNRNADANDLQ